MNLHSTKKYTILKTVAMTAVFIAVMAISMFSDNTSLGKWIFGDSAIGNVQAEVTEGAVINSSTSSSASITFSLSTPYVAQEISITASGMTVGGESVVLRTKEENTDYNVNIQWYRVNDSVYTPISGAVYSTYTPHPEDADCYLLAVIYTSQAPQTPEGWETINAPASNKDGLTQIQKTFLSNGNPVAVAKLNASYTSSLAKIAQIRYKKGEADYVTKDIETNNSNTAATLPNLNFGDEVSIVFKDDYFNEHYASKIEYFYGSDRKSVV